MKKLLLIINLVVVSFLSGSCQSNSKPKETNTNETKPKSSVAPSVVDTTKAISQTSNAGSAGTDAGIKKDTVSKPTKTNAINHSAPNQAQIDSIKKAKTKNKTKSKNKK